MAELLDPRAYYATLRFVRMARKGDDQSAVAARGSLWVDANDEQVWLTPQHVQQYALTERMREGLERGQGGEAPIEQEPATPSRPNPLSTEIRGGHTDTWRWSFVQTHDECPVCKGKGLMQGDGGGWDDGGTYHDPGCLHCRGEGAVPVVHVAIDNQPGVEAAAMAVANGFDAHPVSRQAAVIPLTVFEAVISMTAA